MTAGSTPVRGPSGQPTVEAGTRAPAFRLASSDGTPRSLAELTAGGPALLVFLKTTCPTCGMALPVYGELARRYGDAVPVVAVSQDPMLVTVPWLADHDFRGLALDDTADGYAVSRAFGIQSVPTGVLVDRDAVVSEVVVGWQRAAMNALAARLGQITQRSAEPVSTPDDGRPPEKPG